jgi:hypothetical protein
MQNLGLAFLALFLLSWVLWTAGIVLGGVTRRRARIDSRRMCLSRRLRRTGIVVGILSVVALCVIAPHVPGSHGPGPAQFPNGSAVFYRQP